MGSGGFLWSRLALCADLEEFFADMQSDMLAELQLSPVPSLNDEEMTQKPEEILVSTLELTGFIELSTALGSCRPIGNFLQELETPLQFLLLSSFTVFSCPLSHT